MRHLLGRPVRKSPSKRRLGGLATGVLAAGSAVSVVVIVAIGGEPDPADLIADADDKVTIDAPIADARIVYSAEVGRVLFEADGLASPRDGNVYRLWVVEGDRWRPAGDFVPEDGGVSIVLDGPAEPSNVVVLTIEPEGSADDPTGEELVRFPLSTPAQSSTG